MTIGEIAHKLMWKDDDTENESQFKLILGLCLMVLFLLLLDLMLLLVKMLVLILRFGIKNKYILEKLFRETCKHSINDVDVFGQWNRWKLML